MQLIISKGHKGQESHKAYLLHGANEQGEPTTNNEFEEAEEGVPMNPSVSSQGK